MPDEGRIIKTMARGQVGFDDQLLQDLHYLWSLRRVDSSPKELIPGPGPHDPGPAFSGSLDDLGYCLA